MARPGARPTRSAYRRGEPRADLDLEVAAMIDLRDRMSRARRRALLPAFIAYVVLGHLAVIAHVFGAWSVLGRLSDGSYFISKFTILIALVLPAIPILGSGFLAYVLLRASERRTWEREQLARGVSPEVIATNRLRFG